MVERIPEEDKRGSRVAGSGVDFTRGKGGEWEKKIPCSQEVCDFQERGP